MKWQRQGLETIWKCQLGQYRHVIAFVLPGLEGSESDAIFFFEGCTRRGQGSYIWLNEIDI